MEESPFSCRYVQHQVYNYFVELEKTFPGIWLSSFCMKSFHWWGARCFPGQPLPFKNSSDCQKLLSELKTMLIRGHTSRGCRKKRSVMIWTSDCEVLFCLSVITSIITLPSKPLKGKGNKTLGSCILFPQFCGKLEQNLFAQDAVSLSFFNIKIL